MMTPPNAPAVGGAFDGWDEAAQTGRDSMPTRAWAAYFFKWWNLTEKGEQNIVNISCFAVLKVIKKNNNKLKGQ